MKYDVHSSTELVKLFTEKPFQGQEPSKAKVIIIGNDANYSPQISNHHFFDKILEYHTDGIHFWSKYKKHHPFLLQDYPFNKTKGGVRYHLNFSKMGFAADSAQYFSFVELLNVPTIGNTGSNKARFFELPDKQHLDWLEDIILNGSKKLVLLNQTLASSIKQINQKTGALKKLHQLIDGQETLSIVERSNVTIFNGYSFSYSITNNYLNNLRSVITDFISKS